MTLNQYLSMHTEIHFEDLGPQDIVMDFRFGMGIFFAIAMLLDLKKKSNPQQIHLQRVGLYMEG